MNTRNLGLICALLLTSCAGPRIHTASGRPEITVTGVPTEKVKAEFVGYFINRGYVPKSSDNLVTIFEKPAGAMESILFGTAFNPTAYFRLSLTVLSAGPQATRVICVVSIVSNNRSAFERDVEAGGTEKLQNRLNLMKSNLESGVQIDRGIAEMEAAEKLAAREKIRERRLSAPKGQRTP